MEDEDERREAAIASAIPLQPNFKPAGVKQSQIAKFRELHKRRLQIKARSKSEKKSKGVSDGPGKSHGKHLDVKDCMDNNSSKTIEESSASIHRESNIGDIYCLQPGNEAVQVAPKKRQKLHWGLDTKERWERKANM